LSASEQAIARRVLGLVQLGEGPRDTRRRATLRSWVVQAEQPAQVKAVIEQFSDPDARLITPAAVEGEDMAEVTHEALFNHW